MDSPHIRPATPEEQARILATQHLANTQRRQKMPLSAVDRAYQETARRIEAERLESYHDEPLPPGYTVVFMTDTEGRKVYALQPPEGIEHDITIVSENIRVVLADAWNGYLSRLPDGLPKDTIARMVESPPVPRAYLWRTLWEVALHHRAAQSAVLSMVQARSHPFWGDTQREAQLRVLREFMVASGSISARRAGRLAHLLGLWSSEDPDRATELYIDDSNWVLPWVGLYEKYAAEVDPQAQRWWYRQVASTTTSPKTFKEAEARMTPALHQAWSATYLMAMAYAAEPVPRIDEAIERAKQTLREGMHTSGRMKQLGLLPETTTEEAQALRWCKRSLKKGAPRLYKILSKQFPKFGRGCPEVPKAH